MIPGVNIRSIFHIFGSAGKLGKNAKCYALSIHKLIILEFLVIKICKKKKEKRNKRKKSVLFPGSF